MNARSGYKLCLATAISLVPIFAAIAAEEKKEAASAPAAPPPPAVLVEKAEMRALGVQTEFIGRIQAFAKVDLRARVTGFLRDRKFEAGQDVKEGDVLFEIEREPFEATLAQRRAQLAATEATEQDAKVSLERYQTLESRQVASTAQLDSKIAEQKRAAASVLEAKAAIQNAEIQLSYTTIKSPITGRIGRSSVDPGNLVGPDSGVLATVVRTDKMYALFPVTQAQLLEARKAGENATNLKVHAILADGSYLKEPGVIDFLDVKVDPRTDGQQARAIFPNTDGTLTDGQTVRLAIERRDPDRVLTIPLAAVSTDQGGSFVYVVGPDGTVEERRLKLGATRDAYIGVVDGLKEGDQVIVQGLQKVRAGAKVSAQLATKAGGEQDGVK